jgi:NADPH:quinone reductase-like Zn-dependent oxidoreductase
MRAIVQDGYGGPETLRLADTDPPTPGVGQVRLRVRAAGLDASVWHLMTGRPRVVRFGSGLLRPRARVPGQELVGVVDDVGPGVRRVAVGDEAFGTGRGAFAEFAVAHEARLAPLPPGVPVEAAATLGVSGTTALQAVQDGGEVRAGQRVLVTGAGGGVGSFVVALAVARGAEVTGVAGPDKQDLVRSMGAARSLDYTDRPLTAAGRHDVVVDVAGNRPLRERREVLVPGGTLVLVGSGVAATGFLGGAERQLRGAVWGPFARLRVRGIVGISQRDDLQTLAAMVADGRLVPAVERVVPLEAVPDVVREFGSGHARGKTVVVP